MASSDSPAKDRYDAGPRETGEPARPDRPVSTVVVVAAIVIPLLILAGALLWVRDIGDEAAEAAATEPYSAVPLPAPGAESEACTRLIDQLPPTIGEASQVALTEPASPGTVAYRLPDGEPVVVRCGLPAPPTFVVGVGLQEVNDVQWFNEPDPDPAVTSSTWVAVDRPEYVAVTLPEGSGTGPIQDLSDTIAASMDEVEPDPAPVG